MIHFNLTFIYGKKVLKFVFFLFRHSFALAQFIEMIILLSINYLGTFFKGINMVLILNSLICPNDLHLSVHKYHTVLIAIA